MQAFRAALSTCVGHADLRLSNGDFSHVTLFTDRLLTMRRNRISHDRFVFTGVFGQVEIGKHAIID